MDSLIQKRTDDLLWASVHADDAMGYPNHIVFIPSDQEWSDDSVWRRLTVERKPVALIREHDELIIVAKRQNLLDRVLGQVRVIVERRIDGVPVGDPASSRLGRHPVRETHAAIKPALSH